MELGCSDLTSTRVENRMGRRGGIRGLEGMPLLVSVDPGQSTGVAIFSNGHLVRSFTSVAPHTTLRRELHALADHDEVVCEKGPALRRQAATCEPVEAIIREHALSRTSWVRPTEWKPNPEAVLLDSDTPGTKHERDAIRMGRWHLRRS